MKSLKVSLKWKEGAQVQISTESQPKLYISVSILRCGTLIVWCTCSCMGSVVSNHALPFCTFRRWWRVFNRHFLFVFAYIFNGELQTDVKENIPSHIYQMHDVNAWLKRADAARNTLASSHTLMLSLRLRHQHSIRWGCEVFVVSPLDFFGPFRVCQQYTHALKISNIHSRSMRFFFDPHLMLIWCCVILAVLHWSGHNICSNRCLRSTQNTLASEQGTKRDKLCSLLRDVGPLLWLGIYH